MGLSEVAKAPAQRGNNHNQKGRYAGGIREEGKEIRAFLRKNIQRRHGPAKSNGGSHRHVKDGEEHHGALDKIRQGHGGKAAQEGIENDYKSAQQKSMKVGNPENGIEQLSCCHKAGRSIDDKEKDNKQGADEPETILPILKPVGQIIRNGEAVISHFRVISKPLGYKDPVCPGTDDKADARPESGKAVEVGISRQPHKHPAAHIRSFGAHGSEPWSQLPVPQNVGRQIFLPPGIIKTDTHHQYQVQYESQRNGPIIF